MPDVLERPGAVLTRTPSGMERVREGRDRHSKSQRPRESILTWTDGNVGAATEEWDGEGRPRENVQKEEIRSA